MRHVADYLKTLRRLTEYFPQEKYKRHKARRDALENAQKKAEVTKRRAEAAADKPAEEEAIRKEEHERREAAEAKRRRRMVRIKAREELQRRVEESRERVEEETVRIQRRGAGRCRGRKKNGAGGLAPALESTRNESPEGSVSNAARSARYL